MPYCRDKAQQEQIKRQLIKDNGFADKHGLAFVFVVNYAMQP